MKMCIVLTCNSQELPLRSFPNPCKNRDKFRAWIKATGNEELLQIEPMRIYKCLRICDKHFDWIYKSPTRLLSHAVPTLYMPEPIGNLPKDWPKEKKPVDDAHSSSRPMVTLEDIYMTPKV